MELVVLVIVVIFNDFYLIIRWEEKLVFLTFLYGSLLTDHLGISGAYIRCLQYTNCIGHKKEFTILMALTPAPPPFTTPFVASHFFKPLYQIVQWSIPLVVTHGPVKWPKCLGKLFFSMWNYNSKVKILRIKIIDAS